MENTNDKPKRQGLHTTLVMLPCPFCGGDPEIKQTGRNKLKLRCRSCVMGIEQKTLRYDLIWLETKMIEGWNSRVGGHGA